MTAYKGIMTSIREKELLSWGEFYPDRQLLEKAEASSAYIFADEVGIDYLSLPPKKIGGGDLFGRRSISSSDLMTSDFPVNSMADLSEYVFPMVEDVTLGDLQDEQASVSTLLLLEGPIQLLSSLMPFDLFMVSLIKEKQLIRETMERYLKFLLSITERAKSRNIAGVVMGDDVAGTAGLMMSPKILDNAYFPWLESFIQTSGCQVMVHSDGDVRSIIASYIQAGAVGLQSIERASNMRIEDLAESYPEFLFWGGVSRDALMGDRDLLTEEAGLIHHLKKRGALIAAGSCTGILDGQMEMESLKQLKRIITEG
jgi:hypothetical protein